MSLFHITLWHLGKVNTALHILTIKKIYLTI